MKKSIEFIEDTHQYLLDGQLIPSVSELVRYALNEDLSNVPEDVLKKASEFGTSKHDLIEDYELSGLEEDDEIGTIAQWKAIKELNNIQIIDSEKIIYTDDYAGRYDLLAFVDDEIALIDIKTNRVYPKDHLECQLGFYKYALKDVKKCYCLWLNKSKGEWEFKKVDEFNPDVIKQIIFGFKHDLPTPVIDLSVMNINAYTLQELNTIKAFYDLKQKVEIIEANIKEKVVQYMKENNLTKWEDDNFKISLIDSRIDKTVDVNKMKADGIYEDYLKDKVVKESVRITEKWQKA